MSLTGDGKARQARQLLVPLLAEGQDRLAGARLRVVGAGRGAAPALLALVQAGVGCVWIDDPEDAGPSDEGGWLLPPGSVGSPRSAAIVARLSELSRFTRVERYPTGGVPTATLVCAPTVAESLVAAEQARRAGVPHVVLELDGDAGSVVGIPPGAPCYSCARSTSSAGRAGQAGGAVLACLAAAELLLAMAAPGQAVGRRIEVLRGLVTSRPTVRLAGCACGGGDRP